MKDINKYILEKLYISKNFSSRFAYVDSLTNDNIVLYNKIDNEKPLYKYKNDLYKFYNKYIGHYCIATRKKRLSEIINSDDIFKIYRDYDNSLHLVVLNIIKYNDYKMVLENGHIVLYIKGPSNIIPFYIYQINKRHPKFSNYNDKIEDFFNQPEPLDDSDEYNNYFDFLFYRNVIIPFEL